jgi:hypothetical protein
LEPLPAHRVFKIGNTREVSAWARQAIDEAGANRIGYSQKDNRDVAGQRPQYG